MPDFHLSAVSGATVVTWEDAATNDRPSRLNPNPSIPHMRYRGVRGVAVGATFLRDNGSVDYTVPPFSAWLVEAPGTPGDMPPVVMAGAGNRAEFVPRLLGHYTLAVRHDVGGTILIHFDVE